MRLRIEPKGKYRKIKKHIYKALNHLIRRLEYEEWLEHEKSRPKIMTDDILKELRQSVSKINQTK